MKKIILVVVGIILIAVLGRFGLAYLQVKSDEAKVVNTPALVTTTTQTVPFQSPITTTKPTPAFILPKGGEIFSVNYTKPEIQKISWVPISLNDDESLEFWVSRIGYGVSINLTEDSLFYKSRPDLEKTSVDIKNVDLDKGTADWVIHSDDRTLGFGNSEYRFQLIIKKVRTEKVVPPTSCPDEGPCVDAGGSPQTVLFEIKSNSFQIMGPFY